MEVSAELHDPVALRPEKEVRYLNNRLVGWAPASAWTLRRRYPPEPESNNRRLIAYFSLQNPGLNPNAVLWDLWGTMIRFSHNNSGFFFVILPPMLHLHISLIYRRHYIILALDSVIKWNTEKKSELIRLRQALLISRVVKGIKRLVVIVI
jgi:hypothetical protein